MNNLQRNDCNQFYPNGYNDFNNNNNNNNNNYNNNRQGYEDNKLEILSIASEMDDQNRNVTYQPEHHHTDYYQPQTKQKIVPRGMSLAAKVSELQNQVLTISHERNLFHNERDFFEGELDKAMEEINFLQERVNYLNSAIDKARPKAKELWDGLHEQKDLNKKLEEDFKDLKDKYKLKKNLINNLEKNHKDLQGQNEVLRVENEMFKTVLNSDQQEEAHCLKRARDEEKEINGFIKKSLKRVKFKEFPVVNTNSKK